MLVPVGTKHVARIEATFVHRFACRACGFESLARVRSEGEGQAVSLFFFLEQEAKDVARLEAEQKVKDNADALVEKARCPSCDQRDERAIRREKLVAWLRGVGCGALLSFAVALMRKSAEDWSVSFIVMFLGAALCVWRQSWKWNEVDSRVQVLTSSEQQALVEMKALLKQVESPRPGASRAVAMRAKVRRGAQAE